MVSQLMEQNPESPHVVGCPAAIRALLQDIMDQLKDDILEWAMTAPEPEERARVFQQELGRRRRGLSMFMPLIDHQLRAQKQTCQRQVVCL